MQHTAHLENLSSYTGTLYTLVRWKRVSLIRYCGSYETRATGMDSESRFLVRVSPEIYSRIRVAYELPRGTSEMEFISV